MKSSTSRSKSTGREAGERLKRAIHIARPAVGITSDVDLATRAGVHYDTLMNWYAGRTVPRPAAIRQIAEILDVSYGDLLAAYDGREPEAIPLERAVTDLIAEIRIALVDERHARADLMRAIASSMVAAMSAPPIATMDVPAGDELVGSGARR